MEGEGKKVELIELFYDLIYVYAISKLTLLMEEPEGGIVTWEMISVYIVFFLVIVQAWFMMTNYVNRCCTWKWYEYLLLLINMSAVVALTQSINHDQEASSGALLISLTIMTACVIVLYFIKYRENGPQKAYVKNNLITLGLMEAVFAAALVLRYTGFEDIAKFIIAVNILIGLFVPLLNRLGADASCIHFPHLVERMELFTIIMFGEALISITGFFNLTNPEPIGVMNFFVIVLMFGSYICQIYFMCDHHRVVMAERMSMCHYLIYLAISLITVAFTYLDEGEVDSMVTATLMAISMLMFNMALYATSSYYHDRFSRSTKDLTIRLLISLAGVAIMIGFHDEQYGLAIGALLGFGLNFAYSFLKYRSGNIPVKAAM